MAREIVEEIRITPVFVGSGEFTYDFHVTYRDLDTKEIRKTQNEYMGIPEEFINLYVSELIMDRSKEVTK